MDSSKRLIAVLAAVGTLGFAMLAFSQTRPATGPSTKPMEEVREAQRKARLEYIRGTIEGIKLLMGATEEEWKALQPKIEKVMVSMYSDAQGDYARSRTALLDVLNNKGSTPQDFKDAIEGYREAKVAAETAFTMNQKYLDAARKELRELLMPRQEAVMIIYGVLDVPAMTGSATQRSAATQLSDEAKERKRKERQEMAKQWAALLKESMESTDEEWKVIEPKIQRLVLATYSEDEGAVTETRIAIANLANKKDATPKEFKAAIDDYARARQAWQDAVAKNQKELAAVKKDLRDLLTAKQESILIFRRLLD